MTNISTIKSSSDLDKKELFAVSGSSYQNVRSSSYSENERDDNIDNFYPDSSDSDMLEILSFLVCNFWDKSQLQINTDFAVTGWMLYIISHIRKYSKYHSDSDHRKQVKNVTKTLFHG